MVSAAIKLAADPGFEVIYLGNARGTGPIGALDVKAADEDVKVAWIAHDNEAAGVREFAGTRDVVH